MASFEYFKERFLQGLIKLAWDGNDPAMRLRLLRALELPEELVDGAVEVERRVNFPDSAPIYFAGRWGRIDLRFTLEDDVRAWVELKLTASPDSLKLSAYAAALPGAVGRLVSPYWPGWADFPQAEGPSIRHILLSKVLAELGPIDGVSDLLGLCEDMAFPATQDPGLTIAELLSPEVMPKHWRWADAASGAVLAAEMERVGLREMVREMDTEVEADMAGSVPIHLRDRPFFAAWLPRGDGHDWEGAEIQFFRSGGYGPLTTVQLFVMSYSDADPAVAALPEWMEAGASLAAGCGWGPPVPTTTSPTAGNDNHGAGIVFDADPLVMTRADLGETMKATVQRLGRLEGLRRPNGIRQLDL